jgi:D-alanyl-D-alanine carboxypeptidase (penicillin-binding protein 5/6)
MTRIRLVALILAALAAALPALAFDTRARSAWVYDLTNDTVLLAKNADTPLPPASMSKLMTLNMLFEALKDGRVRLDDRFGVSARARAMGGSTMFLDETDRPTAEELIKGIIVNSGNDACVVVAEGLGGSEETFSAKMTERARALGMMNSTFRNASGWPAPGHEMSSHDLGLLAIRLITEFPEYYGYFALTEFEFDGRSPDNRFNRNPLLGLGIGADGLKTGHTEEAGYGLVGSAIQNGRRIVFVIAGLSSMEERAEESERIATWAFREFAQKTVARKGTEIALAPVFMGAEETISLTVAEDVSMLLPSLVQDKVAGEVSFRQPVLAPVTAGDALGELVLSIPDRDPVTIPLVAAADVPRAGFFGRIRLAAGQIAGRALSLVGG